MLSASLTFLGGSCMCILILLFFIVSHVLGTTSVWIGFTELGLEVQHFCCPCGMSKIVKLLFGEI